MARPETHACLSAVVADEKMLLSSASLGWKKMCPMISFNILNYVNL